MSKIPSIVRRRYQKTKELSQEVFDKVEINKNLYHGIINVDDNYEWDYSLVDPHVFPLVRNYLSRSNPSFTKIRLEARKFQDFEKRQINQDFLNWELGEILLTTLYYRMYFSAYVAGRGYAKTGWKYEPAIEIKVKDENGKVTTQKTMRDIINRADAKFVRFNDLLIPNRNEPLLYSQPYVIELIQQRVGDMLDENNSLEERGEKPYWDKKWLNKLKKSGVTGKLLDYQMEMATDADSKEDMAFKSAYVAMMCMHTLEGDVYYLPIDGEDEVLNTDTTNRYWHGHYPYIDFCPFPEDDEYYSPALVDIVGDLQIAATEVLNQTLTNIRQINTDMWIAGSDASQTPDWQFSKRPSGIIRVAGDASQVQQVRTQDNTMPAMRFADSLQTKIERSGGISSLYSSGAPSQNINQTARGAQIIEQNIDSNMRMIIDLFGEQVIKRTGEHFLSLNAQYVTEEQSFFVTGKKGVREVVTLDPEQVTANFDVYVNAERMVKQTPASLQANMQNLITTLASQANQAQVQLDFVPLFESLIDAYPEMENVEDIVMSVDEKAKRDAAMLERGQMPEIKVRDPHQDLIMAINIHFEENQMMYPEEIKSLFEKYVERHMRYIQSQQEIQAMTQPQIPQGMDPAAMQQSMVSTPSEMAGLQEGIPNQGYDLGSILPQQGV
jgi:hypothetical protein